MLDLGPGPGVANIFTNVQPAVSVWYSRQCQQPRRGRVDTGHHVVSVYDPPDSVASLAGTHPRGMFATLALVTVQSGPPVETEWSVGAGISSTALGLAARETDIGDDATVNHGESRKKRRGKAMKNRWRPAMATNERRETR